MNFKVGLFGVLSAAASGWALWLVTLHNKAIAATLSPGLLCGEGGGCGEVLASEWSTLPGGIAVSAPAVPMYALLAALAVATLRGRMTVNRLAALGTLCGSVGLLFGGWLLFHMLVDVQQVCTYCLIMDGLNLAVLVTALALGGRDVLHTLPQTLQNVIRPRPEAALLPAILAGTALLTVALPPPNGPTQEEIDAAVAAALQTPDAPASDPQTDPIPATTETVAHPANSGEAEETGETRRVMLQPATVDFPLDNVPIAGPADAPITIVLFEDFQCPFCRQLAGNLHALQAAHPDTVRIAWYHFPMHTDCNPHAPSDMHDRACTAAMAGVCAHEQDRFWPMHDTLFFNSARLSNRDIRQYAVDNELDVNAFDACMRRPETLAKVRADAAVGAEAQVRGTPTFFINGRRLSGAQPVEVLEAVIDAVQQQAEGERVRLEVPLRGEVLGAVSSPATTTLTGPYGAFSIDSFEASIVDGVAVSQPGVEPARGVSWYEAQAACEAAGKRLCTEEEWLTACTGAMPNDEDGDGIYSDERIQGRLHPYGTYPQSTWCASSRQREDERPLITGNHPRCLTPDGVADLEGGIKEWVGLSPDRAGLKGGSYYSGQSARCGYFKRDVPPDGSDDSMGFRCCRGSEPVDRSAERYPGGKVGDVLQSFSLPTASGETWTTASLDGQAAILTFWASWCGPCKRELPALAELYEQYSAQGLMVIGINIDQDVRDAQAYLRANPLPFPVLLDTDNALMARFDAQSVPTTFWVTRTGQIRQKTTGYSESQRDEVEEFVQQLLQR